MKLPTKQMIAVAAQHRQSGAVLIVGLVVLLVVTIFGVSAMQTTVLQERMAGNLRQSNIALQAAEAGVQAGLAYLEQWSEPPIADDAGIDNVWTTCTADMVVVDQNGQSLSNACTRLERILADWQDDPTDLVEGAEYANLDLAATGFNVEGLDGVFAQPRVYIERRYLPSLDMSEAAEGKGTHYYAVTAVGYGENARAIVIVQSNIAKVYRY